jgi:hypothetical protein
MEKIKKLSIIALASIVLSLAISSLAGAYDYSYSSYDEAAFLGFGLVMCVLYLIILVVWIIVAIWAYKDAEKRGMNGLLWALVVFFLGLIGLIIYIVVRSGAGGGGQQQGGSGRMCPSCGRPIPMDARVCPYCGKNFDQQ